MSVLFLKFVVNLFENLTIAGHMCVESNTTKNIYKRRCKILKQTKAVLITLSTYLTRMLYCFKRLMADEM